MALIIKNQYVWDFWYLFDKKTNLFKVFFLYADMKFVPEDKHHFYAKVGSSKTLDWVDFFDTKLEVLKASPDRWADTSIWTGDAISYKKGFSIFYTSRNSKAKDPMSQSIGIAYKTLEKSLEILPTKIEASSDFYLTESDPLEKTIQCWRDPYLFEINDRIYMLIAAKRKNYPLNKRGCVALMGSVDQNDLTQWRHLGPIISTKYSEVELPQIYRTTDGKLRLFFNAQDENKQQYYIMTDPFMFNEHCFEDFRLSDLCETIPESQKYYGYRIVPELGLICGFNKLKGGIEIIGNIPSLEIGLLHTIKPSL